MADPKNLAAVEAMVTSLQSQLEGIDVQALSRRIADRDPSEVALNSFGTAGTAGTLSGCFGTAGTFGSLGATELAEAQIVRPPTE
ncbi:hypothetical protein [Streptomyces sp. NPDC058614]|uniref:hypothetical protein n=1 Tax=Streptomyces sp. NPDC058614 TaxID=3346557 RepID=UPI00365905E1